VTLETVLLLGAALFATGLYGALAMGSLVMILMGLELMVNGAIVTIVGMWFFLSPERPDGQIFAMMALLVMAIEAAMGFAVAIALFRARDVDMVDMAADLRE
jgi:NAD(P)H-quinone oxidoreductase subunit 4L